MYRPISRTQHSQSPMKKSQQHEIHILGLGSIGLFAAHCLTEVLDPAKVTLLLHHPSILDAYIKAHGCITIETPAGKKLSSSGYSVEVRIDEAWRSPKCLNDDDMIASKSNLNRTRPITRTIANLILCVRASQTVEAIRSVMTRLTRDSSILFLQHGLGND